MPSAPPRPCLVCQLIYCTEHATPSHGWGSNRTAGQRTRGRASQAIKADLLEREPYCRICTRAGRRTLAVVVDHILCLAEGGQDIPENRQPLCQPCHDRKTQQEARRGRKQWWLNP